MQFVKILVLAGFLTMGVNAGRAAETALPLPATAPLGASITGAKDAQPDHVMQGFALACGLLAFAAAAQQAFFSGRPAMQRIRTAKR